MSTIEGGMICTNDELVYQQVRMLRSHGMVRESNDQTFREKYINENIKINPFLHGGAQERNMRAGTENVYGIVGFAKALELSNQNHDKDKAYISGLKKYIEEILNKVV